MKKIFALLIILTSITISNGQNWKATSSSITFSIKHAMGSTANGTFGNLNSDINFNPSKLNEAKIVATIDAVTFNTGNTSRDKTLKGKEYFDVEKYPKITMNLLKVAAISASNFSGTFALTIKNTTKEITVPFTFTQNGTTALFKGEFTINRLDYKVGESSWLLGDDATVKITLNVKQ